MPCRHPAAGLNASSCMAVRLRRRVARQTLLAGRCWATSSGRITPPASSWGHGSRCSIATARSARSPPARRPSTVDRASGRVDPDVAWNIGSVTKTFVALVVLQRPRRASSTSTPGSTRTCPTLPEPTGTPPPTSPAHQRTRRIHRPARGGERRPARVDVGGVDRRGRGGRTGGRTGRSVPLREQELRGAGGVSGDLAIGLPVCRTIRQRRRRAPGRCR
jgi:hypothetical protein